jgi:hypothetical protein
LLEVHVGDPLGEPSTICTVLAVAVGDVAGVQAEVDVCGSVSGEEALDAFLGGPTCVSTWGWNTSSMPNSSSR